MAGSHPGHLLVRWCKDVALMLTELARAKINLTLRVLGRRSDGYHDLESLVAFARCADRLTLEAGRPLGLDVMGATATDTGDIAQNLVLKAATALAARIGSLKLGHFTLDKRLPVAAGIGGGSADAAAALRLLARANDIALDDPRLFEAARATGADVPVCLASRACIMRGAGEVLTPVTLPRLPALLVNPRRPVSTANVFAALGVTEGARLSDPEDALSSTASAAWIAAIRSGTNDLQAPALRLEPAIGEVVSALQATQGCAVARMSGSGATCFALYDNAADALHAAHALRRMQPFWWVRASGLG
jgi:4-diphosphocytidyl-2-C-methyl-D-erythritol kinase